MAFAKTDPSCHRFISVFAVTSSDLGPSQDDYFERWPLSPRVRGLHEIPSVGFPPVGM